MENLKFKVSVAMLSDSCNESVDFVCDPRTALNLVSCLMVCDEVDHVVIKRF